MAVIWRIKLDFSKLQALPAQLKAEARRAAHDAIGGVAAATAVQWQDAVHKARLWQKEKSEYFESIAWRYTGELSAEVWTDYKPAEDIETGRPARDLKRMLNTSMRVRVSKKGRRYLVIPFRHNMNELESAGVYQTAKALTASSVTSMGVRSSGTGAINIKTKQQYLVPQAHYKWGERMASDQPRLAGLYRFNTSSGKQKSSAYLTFRTMAEGSPGWIARAQPGLYLAKQIAEGMQPQAEAMVAAAIGGTSS